MSTSKTIPHRHTYSVAQHGPGSTFKRLVVYRNNTEGGGGFALESA